MDPRVFRCVRAIRVLRRFSEGSGHLVETALLVVAATAACSSGDGRPVTSDAPEAAGTQGTSGVPPTTGEDAGEDTGDAPPAITYWADIEPILDARCASCHAPDGIAPFSLTSYEDARTFMPVSLPVVHARTMPPWPPNDDCNGYVGNPSLTDAQIDLVDTWVDLGMPEGDPANEGPPLLDDTPGLSRVDLTLQMQEPYAPGQLPDDYRCFVLEWPSEQVETTYVTGFGVRPGNPSIVHHVIAFLAGPEDAAAYESLDAADPGPGYTCFGGSNGPSDRWLAAWAPGARGSDFPEGIGIAIEPGSRIVLQVHYNSLTSEVDPDATAIEVRLDDAVARPARVMPVANLRWLVPGGMPIPAGDPDVEHAFSFDPTVLADGRSLLVYVSALHMHLLGKSARLSIERSGGASTCLLQIDDWDFGWQTSYTLVEPEQIDPGDALRLACRFDNSAENQPFVDGEKIEPRDVEWGEGTTDEMCLGILLVADR